MATQADIDAQALTIVCAALVSTGNVANVMAVLRSGYDSCAAESVTHLALDHAIGVMDGIKRNRTKRKAQKIKRP